MSRSQLVVEIFGIIILGLIITGIIYGTGHLLNKAGIKDYKDTIECPDGLKLTYMPGNGNDPYRCLMPVRKKAE